MTEFSRKRDDRGKNKICMLCQTECSSNAAADYSRGIVNHYFECRGHGGCGAVVCEECQKARVSDFETQPMVFIYKLTQEGVLAEFLERFEVSCQGIDEGEEMEEAVGGYSRGYGLNLSAIPSQPGVQFESPKTSQVNGVKAP